METSRYIAVTEFCSCHQIDYAFIESLSEYGLVQIMRIEETEVLDRDQVREVEKMVRLHYDLDINLEGIDAISHLLSRVSELQNEVRILQNRLRRYEE